ncbi:MAG: hypothetical protein GWN87_17960, partial [Desulfuromonadales bacterium]|nr:hypothetical protein [Desulfuromonadales bacterium]
PLIFLASAFMWDQAIGFYASGLNDLKLPKKYRQVVGDRTFAEMLKEQVPYIKKSS